MKPKEQPTVSAVVAREAKRAAAHEKATKEVRGATS